MIIFLVLTSSCFHIPVAMKDASRLDSRLHRDISIGNIILVKEPNRATRKGYLIDWDASCRVDESGAAIEPGRVVS